MSSHTSLAVDNLVDTEVVLASGEIVRANEKENQDLFWALRGMSPLNPGSDIIEVLDQTLALSRSLCSKRMSKGMCGRDLSCTHPTRFPSSWKRFKSFFRKHRTIVAWLSALAIFPGPMFPPSCSPFSTMAQKPRAKKYSKPSLPLKPQ